MPAGTAIEMWLGISTDEAARRVRDSRVKWIENVYPLIGVDMSRQDCIDWFAARYGRPLERSACVVCPFQARARWIETRDRYPDLFAEAVHVDAMLRAGQLRYDKTPYLHPRRVPLQEAIALDEREMDDRDGFGNECEGHCGL